MHRRFPLLAFISRHRQRLLALTTIAGVVATGLTVAAAVALRRGDWPEQRFLLMYVAPLFVFGAHWARYRIARLDHTADGVLLLDGIVFVAGALRIAGGWGVLPYSGHMLFLTYAAATPAALALRIAAVLLIAMTSVFKLVLWHDPVSWGLGLVAGAALAIVRTRLGAQAEVARPRPR